MTDLMTQARHSPSGLDQPEPECLGPQQYLTFQLQGEMFGLDIRPIKEIIEYGHITSVPMVPSFIRGVINLRGNVVPVVDLPVRFGWNASPVTKRTCVVIVEIEYEETLMEFGLVIDSVSEVLDIPASEVAPAPNFGAKIRTEFIAGMGKIQDLFVILLNASKVLSIQELSALGQLTESH